MIALYAGIQELKDALIISGVSQKQLIGSYLNLNLSLDDQTIFYTSNGRRPQNIKSGISQQPLIGLCSYL